MNDSSLSPSQLEQGALEDFRQGSLDAAIAGFTVAREAYEAGGDTSKAAEMSNNICVALLQAGRPAEALDAVRPTPALFAALGDQLRTAQAYGNLAAALEATGDAEQAERNYQQAAEMFARSGEQEGRAQTLKALSQLQLKKGKTIEAVASMQASMEGSARLTLGQRFLRWLMKIQSRLLGN